MASDQTVQFIYDPAVLERIRTVNANLATRFDNLSWMWDVRQGGRTIPEILAENEQQVFSAGQGTWTPISEKYRQYKVRRGFDSRVLVKTGAMMRAATSPGASGNVAFGDARNYYYGVNAQDFREHGGWSYPEIHQVHGQNGVRRRFVFLGDQTAVILQRFFGAAVEDELQAQARNSKLKSLQARRKKLTR